MTLSSESVVTIIQARMNSARLPGKVMLDWNGAPMLQRLIERVATSEESDKVVVATSDTPADDVIETLCKKLEVGCFRGSEQHVLERFVQTSTAFNAQVVVRLTGDNPFVNGELVDCAVREFFKHSPKIDYLSNTDNKYFPYGLFVEVIRASTLDEICQNANAEEAEHVTLRIRKNPATFRTRCLSADREYPNISLTVDTYQDAVSLLPIFKSLVSKNEKFGLLEIATIKI
jgi:spore coat polysaccharide biosynthesis protein SpsF